MVVQPGFPCGVCDYCLAGDYIHCEHMHDFAHFTGSKEGMFTMAQYILKPDWLLSPIPADVSYEHAGLAICGLGPTFEACDVMRIGSFDTVLIAGLGPVGLGGIVNARQRGARVIGVDNNPYRASLALELGAEVVIDPKDPQAVAKIRDLTRGRGADKAIDCTGIPDAIRLCMDAIRRRGEIAFVGWGTSPAQFTTSVDMVQKGPTFHGVWHYNLASYSRVMEVIRNSPVVGKLITHSFPMRDIQKAWETQVSGKCGKVMLLPWA